MLILELVRAHVETIQAEGAEEDEDGTSKVRSEVANQRVASWLQNRDKDEATAFGLEVPTPFTRQGGVGPQFIWWPNTDTFVFNFNLVRRPAKIISESQTPGVFDDGTSSFWAGKQMENRDERFEKYKKREFTSLPLTSWETHHTSLSTLAYSSSNSVPLNVRKRKWKKWTRRAKSELIFSKFGLKEVLLEINRISSWQRLSEPQGSGMALELNQESNKDRDRDEQRTENREQYLSQLFNNPLNVKFIQKNCRPSLSAATERPARAPADLAGYTPVASRGREASHNYTDVLDTRT
ncbi:hypothetical protein EVAR_25166_1 [Eumeta japonica]|uniref:Uncharacterized protein n=1 Tax=Eumeta variegata TaxID=151549 RepID=A0A4C1VQC3_EUMVA|nr:hypothetical protein EVAR_25166_1 [Eumeta japonica]